MRNDLLEKVNEIEEIELELTVFNSKRALANIDKNLQVETIGNCKLLIETSGPESIYYNRVKGFGVKDLDKVEKILEVYHSKGITPCFDMTPNNINEETSKLLSTYGYLNVEQLVFMHLTPKIDEKIDDEVKIVEVNEENAEEFVNIIIRSNGGMNIDNQVIERKKKYFYEPNFKNYIAYIDNEVAGMASLFISEEKGYIANDFTFEKFRGKGVQKVLLKHRINKALELGIKKLYTDVEFGSISHNNMEKLGFKTIFINSFFIKI